MIKIGLLLHIYQPPTQFESVFRRIVEESYRPLVELCEQNPRFKLTLNLVATLTEGLVELGYADVVSGFADLAEVGQVELTGSAKFHPLLSKLPPSEVRHQVHLNQRTNERLLKGEYRPRGFFPPEMAYAPHLKPILADFGFEWLVLDQSAVPSAERSEYACVYELEGEDMRLVTRHTQMSLEVAFKGSDDVDEFVGKLEKEGAGDCFVLVMDGETFGHHHPGYWSFLRELLGNEGVEFVTVSELVDRAGVLEEVEPLNSTWGQTERGVVEMREFPRWDNPENPVHELQWQLLYLAVNVVQRSESSVPGHTQARNLLDQGEHSDQFWWAAGDPVWHPGMVQRGAELLRDAVLAAPFAHEEERRLASLLYGRILTLGEELFGDEIVKGR